MQSLGSDRRAAVLVLGAALLAYASCLPGAFHYDDESGILSNPAVRDARLLPRYFADPTLFTGAPGGRMYRPVVLASYLQDYLCAEYRPLVWHSTNWLLHGLNSFLVVLLAAGVLRVLGAGRPHQPAAWLAGLAFALHPVHSEVVNYVSARSCSLATAGFVAAFLCHLAWTRGPRTALPLAASLACFALALGSKEIAIALVPCVLAFEMLDPAGGPFRPRLARALARTAPVLAVGIGYLALRHALFGQVLAGIQGRVFAHPGAADPDSGAGRTVWQNLLTQARVLWIYLRLLAWPAGLTPDRYVRVSTSLAEPSVLLSLAGLAVLLAALARQVRPRPAVAFAGLFFLLCLAPTSSLIPLNVVMNEHRLYLPGVGAALLLGLAIEAAWRRWPRPAAVAAACAAVACVALVQARNRAWQHPETLWRGAVQVSPNSYRAHNQLGRIHASRARALKGAPPALELLDRAIAEFRTARALYPRWNLIDVNLGLAFKDRAAITRRDADFEHALAHFRFYEDKVGGVTRAGHQIAMTYAAWGRPEDAINKLKTMADEDRAAPSAPRRPEHLLLLAQLTERVDRAAEAERLYREVIESDPGNPYGNVRLAELLQRHGRVGEGRRCLERLERRRPLDPGVQIAWARYLRGTDPAGAVARFDRAVRLGHAPLPGERAYYGRARAPQ